MWSHDSVSLSLEPTPLSPPDAPVEGTRSVTVNAVAGQVADLIDDDMRALINGPTSVLCATADRMNTPDVTRVAGLGVVGHNRFRVLIAARAVAAVTNITTGARCAISAGDMTNYRTIQWKGTVVQACERSTPGDIALQQRHLAAFTEGTRIQGMPWRQAMNAFPRDVVAFELEVDQMFDQTPGRGAGRRIA